MTNDRWINPEAAIKELTCGGLEVERRGHRIHYKGCKTSGTIAVHSTDKIKGLVDGVAVDRAIERNK